MPPKRAGEHLSFEKAHKRPNLMKEEAVNVVDGGLEKKEDLVQANDQKPAPTGLSASAKAVIHQLNIFVALGTKDLVRQLLDSLTVNLKTPEGGELLWTAYKRLDKEMVALLIRYGVELNARHYDDNRTLLHHILMSHGGYPDIFRMMLDHGADVNARTNRGQSLLTCAIISESYSSNELAEELLKHGAQITINKEDWLMDDICLACKRQIDLLPKLIQHQEPDEKTRNERAVIAINHLISEDYTGYQRALAMQMIKKILDLGVPVDVPHDQLEKRQFSFLIAALCYKNKYAVQLLLEYGADPRHYNLFGQSTLYQATAFVGYTQVSRWFIEKGVSIHEENYNGGYPIHGACHHESLRNLHLLLSLGADLNVTDKYGQTPFGMMKMNEKRKNREVHHLVIKHLALIIARGGKIYNEDMDRIDKCLWGKNHFDSCTEQLERMKVEKVYSDLSYFTLLSKNMYSALLLVKNQNFRESFKQNQEKRAALFPEFFYMLLHFFEIAEKRLEVLLAEKVELYDVFMGFMPDHIVEKISYYLCFEKLEQCQHDYFMSFHAKLTISKNDKAKIL